MEWIIIAILIILLGIVGWFAFIQLKARVLHQHVMCQMLIKMQKALVIMRTYDQTGAFQSHDEVGQTFALLAMAIQELRNYFIGALGNAKKAQ